MGFCELGSEWGIHFFDKLIIASVRFLQYVSILSSLQSSHLKFEVSIKNWFQLAFSKRKWSCYGGMKLLGTSVPQFKSIGRWSLPRVSVSTCQFWTLISSMFSPSVRSIEVSFWLRL